MPIILKPILLVAVATLAVSVAVAQFRSGGGRGYRGDDSGSLVRTEQGGIIVDENTVRTARETASHSTGTPNWTNAVDFEQDVFTFTRIIFKSRGMRGGGGGVGAWGWLNDYPDSDLNLSYRLQQLTSMKVDPDARVLKLTDPALADYPFIYMVKPGNLEFRDEEVVVLRKYLLNGGVLVADDFWGDDLWNNFAAQMKRILPERTWSELPMEHPLFHSVFDLRVAKRDLQVPSIRRFNRSTGEFRLDSETEEMHVRAWHDDRKRIMIVAFHNSDNGDGWEREGENDLYFHTFSEKRAYPLAINLIFYLMTH
jgi:hypothetical protein